jgi:type III restriction enzyme
VPAHLAVTPGIRIKDRLRVLLPSDPQNYYRALDVAPPDLLPELHKARIVITNFHAFKPREKVAAGRLTKPVLKGNESGAFVESPGEMVRRVCRELGTKRNIVVINKKRITATVGGRAAPR